MVDPGNGGPVPRKHVSDSIDVEPEPNMDVIFKKYSKPEQKRTLTIF